jgi:hypothetical protein
LERPGVAQAEHPAERVVAWGAVAQAKERLLRPAELSHVRTVLAAARHRAQRNEPDFVQVVTGIVLARVGDVRETRDEPFHAAPPRLIPGLGIQVRAAPHVYFVREKS